jgi:hypothetical protein
MSYFHGYCWSKFHLVDQVNVLNDMYFELEGIVNTITLFIVVHFCAVYPLAFAQPRKQSGVLMSWDAEHNS